MAMFANQCIQYLISFLTGLDNMTNVQ